MFNFFKHIAKAFKTSFSLLSAPKVTLNYPYEKEHRDAKARRSHVIDTKKCVACNTCAKACPSNAITVKFHCNGNDKVLDKFSIDYGKCCFCGMCAEACHKKAITLSAENAQTFRKTSTVKTIVKR